MRTILLSSQIWPMPLMSRGVINCAKPQVHSWHGYGYLLCFSQKLDLGASASVAKSLFHWLRGRLMMLKRMLRIQFL